MSNLCTMWLTMIFPTWFPVRNWSKCFLISRLARFTWRSVDRPHLNATAYLSPLWSRVFAVGKRFKRLGLLELVGQCFKVIELSLLNLQFQSSIIGSPTASVFSWGMRRSFLQNINDHNNHMPSITIYIIKIYPT